MATVTLLKKALGLNNAVDPTRIKHSLETGETELATAYNVDIDSAGRISMRRGLTATARTEAVHSMFCDGGECLFIAGSALYRLNADYTRTGVRSSMQVDAKCSYCQIADRIYYMNGYQIGYVVNGVSYVWSASAYVGPATTRRFNDPPLGTLLELHSSRIYVAVGSIIWYSEPFAYGWFDLAGNFIPLRSRIRMLRSVKSGMFVGTETEVIFLGGMTPKEFSYTVVSDRPVVEGTDLKVAGTKIAGGDNSDQAAMWTAQDGIYVGLPDGTVKNLTRDKLVLPGSNTGCAVFNGRDYLTLLQ
jgi:hypothetical protein